MFQAVMRALLRAVVTLFLAITFTFIILRVSGDPLHSLLPVETPPEVVALMRQQWGLDQPLYIQYFPISAIFCAAISARRCRMGRMRWCWFFPRFPQRSN